MNWPLYDSGVASGLLAGVLFGYVLENAGFGSPRKLSAQFRLQDWSVFKVMFTAVLVAAVGLWLARSLEWIAVDSYYIPTPFYWAILAGGLLIGAGFALGGYCPGTSVVGLSGGRLDALVFMAGMVLGTALFANRFSALEGLYYAAEGPGGQTLMDLTGMPEWLILLVLVVFAVAGFRLGSRLEARFGGPLEVEDIYSK